MHGTFVAQRPCGRSRGRGAFEGGCSVSKLMDETDYHSTMLELIAEFAQIGRSPTGAGVTRLAYSASDWRARERFLELCRADGMSARLDAAGNVVARRLGRKPDLPAVAIGSHLDTVREGGRLDGALGVMAALEVVRRLNREGLATDRSIEVIAFAGEESTRFSLATIGSRAMAGLLDVASAAALKDEQGSTLADAVKARGLRLADFPQARRRQGELAAFIELHIEQGPTLEAAGAAIGLVTAIAAATRYRIVIDGVAGHSGTTAMGMRHDALAAAAQVVLLVEQLAGAERRADTGTVGVLRVWPGSPNTIPARVELIAEFRAADQTKKRDLSVLWQRRLQEIAHNRRVRIEADMLSDDTPVALPDAVRSAVREACETGGHGYREMVSGAAHDCMNMAALCPAGLIFIPSVRGVSHHPDEESRAEHLLAGVDVLYRTVIRLAAGSAR